MSPEDMHNNPADTLPERTDQWSTVGELLAIVRKYPRKERNRLLLSQETFEDTKHFVEQQNLHMVFHGTKDITCLANQVLRPCNNTDSSLHANGPWYQGEVPVFLSNSLITSGGFGTHSGAVFAFDPSILDGGEMYENDPNSIKKAFRLAADDLKVAEKVYLDHRVPYDAFTPGVRKEYHAHCDIPLTPQTVQHILLPVDSPHLEEDLELLEELGFNTCPLHLYSASAMDFFSYVLDEQRKYTDDDKGMIIPMYVYNASRDARRKMQDLTRLLKDEQQSYKAAGYRTLFL